MMITWGGIARLLRRRVVLGLIFGLSLTYCAISLFAHEKIGSSIANYGEDENNDAMIDNDDLIVDPDPEDDIRDKHIPWPPPASDDGGLDPNNDFNSGVVERNCRNSIQGKALIVDERGLVCARKEVLPGGCCREDAEKTDRYSCETCNPEGCCAVYEYCVSCCLHPGKRRSKKDAQSGPAVRRDGEKSRRTEDAVKLHFRNLDRFQICLAVCRTSSASVRHENTYKDPNSKHCYINSPGHQRVQRDLISVNNNGDNIAITSSTVRDVNADGEKQLRSRFFLVITEGGMGLGAFDAILVLVSTSGLLLNTYVLLIALGLNKQSQQIQTANTALLLIHLSIVESLTCLALVLFTTGGWPLTGTWCVLHGFLFSLLHPVALWTVTGLNCDRYYAISAPLHYTGVVSRRRVIIGLTSSWLFSLILCLPPFSGFVPSYKYSPDFGYCIPNFSNARVLDTGSIVYAAIYVILGLILPIFLVTICNLRILGIARYHRHRIASAIYEVTLSAQVTITHQRNPFYVPTITSPNAGGPPRFHSAASTVMQLIGPLYLLYFPYCGLILWEACSGIVMLSQSGPQAHLWIASLASLLLAISPLINGILYGVKSRTLRRTFQNYRRKKVTKSELQQEIQARTPSAAGSRRASGNGPVSLFPFPPPQRHLSEALLYLGKSPRNSRFGSHENMANFNRSRLQFASCNTLQVPNSEGGETTNKMIRTSASAVSLMDHAYQSESLSINQDDIYPSDSSKRSPRILITRPYSVESPKSVGSPLLKHNCAPGNSSNISNEKRRRRHASTESDSSTGSSDLSVWTTKIPTKSNSVNLKNSVNNWPVGRRFRKAKTLEEGAKLFAEMRTSNSSESSHADTTATLLPSTSPERPIFSMEETKHQDTTTNEAKGEENPSGSESSWSSVEENDGELPEYNGDELIQDASSTEGETIKDVDFIEPTKYRKRRKEKG